VKKKTKRFQTFIRVLSLVAGAALFVLVFRDIDFSMTFSLIANVGYYLMPIYAVYGVGCLFDTAAWKFILDTPSEKISFAKLLQVHIAGEAMYRFIPAGVVVGEGVKIFLMTKQSRFSGPEVVSSLAIRKLLVGLSQGFYIGVSVFLGIVLAQKIGIVQLFSLGSALFVFAVFLSLGIMLSRGSLFTWIFRLLRSIPFIKTKIENEKLFFERADIELRDFFLHKKRQGGLASLLFFGGWLTEMLETYLILVALGLKVLPYQVMVFEPVVSLTRSLAFLIPGGLGVVDSSYLSAFSSAGIANVVSAGAAFVIIKRSKELFWIIIGLFLTWLQGTSVPEETKAQSLPSDIAPEIV